MEADAPVWEDVCVVLVVVEDAVVRFSSWSMIISMMSIAVYFDLPAISSLNTYTDVKSV